MNTSLSQLSPGRLASTRPLTSPKEFRNGHRAKVLAYQRVSMHEDQSGSHTFETQTLRIHEKLDQLYGVDAYDLEMLTDNGISGAYGLVPSGVQRRTRPTLTALAEKLKSRTYDCLIVYNFSRMARSPRWFHQLLEDVIIPSGVDFVSATQDINLSSADGRAMAGMLAVMDGFYRDGVVQRNRDAAATRSQQGYYVGMVGYGWEWEPLANVPQNARRRIRPVPEQGRWIGQMKDWYLAGWHLTRITGELNTLGVPSASGKSRWTTAVVHKILHNPVHAGLVPLGRHGQEWVRGEHFDFRFYADDTLDQLRQATAGRRRWKTNALKSNEHLLNALVFCDRCGHRLYVSSNHSIYRGYRCQNGTDQGQRTCPTISVRADELESLVVRELTRFAQEPQMRELLGQEASRATEAQSKQLQAEQSQLRERLASLTARRQRWVEALGDGTLTKEEFRATSHTNKAECEEVAQRLEQTEAALANRQVHEAWVRRVQALVLDIPTIWEHLTPDEHREVLSLVIEKLTVDRVGRDAIVKIKVQLLPEQQIPLMFKSLAKITDKPTGVLALTPRQLAALYHLGQNKSQAEAAKLMDVSYSTFNTLARQAATRLAVPLDEAVKLARDRIEELLPTLPLGAFHNQRSPRQEVPLLSPALMEVLTLLAQGATALEIAVQTGLPRTTVEGRRSRILDLLGARTVFEAGQKARELGLLNAE